MTDTENSEKTIDYLDERALDAFITEVATKYASSAPTVADWAESLYQRVQDEPERVTLFELRQFARLREEDFWMQPNYAANIAYKVADRLGRDTTGMLGF